MEQQVPVRRTVVTLPEYVGAVLRAWPHVADGLPTKASVAVLWGHYRHETGGSDCWGWNIGNVKHVAGDGYDYQCLNGVWEGFDQDTAARLIASGEARPDGSLDHARAVGQGRVSVIFNPPHPATRFRVFLGLEVAMVDHLKFLSRRFGSAWAAVLAGDDRACAYALKARKYFTASAEAYAAGMHRGFVECMASSAYENGVAELEELRAAETQPEVPNPDSDPVLEADGGDSRRDATSEAVAELATDSVNRRNSG